MEEELYDPEKFLVCYPLYLVYSVEIMADEREDPFDAIAKGDAALDGNEKATFLAVFTDEDWAERFINEFGLPSCQIKPTDKDVFFAILKKALAKGIHHVGFDVAEQRGKVFPISDFIGKSP